MKKNFILKIVLTVLIFKNITLVAKDKYPSNICTNISYSSEEMSLRKKLLNSLERDNRYNQKSFNSISFSFIEASEAKNFRQPILAFS